MMAGELIKKVILALAWKRARVWADELKAAELQPGRDEMVRWLNTSTVTVSAWSIVATLLSAFMDLIEGKLTGEAFAVHVAVTVGLLLVILIRKAIAKNEAQVSRALDDLRKQLGQSAKLLLAVAAISSGVLSPPTSLASDAANAAASSLSTQGQEATAETAGAAAVKGWAVTLAPALSPESFGDFITKMGDTVAFPMVYSIVDTAGGPDTGGGFGVHARMVKLKIDATEISLGPAYVVSFGDTRTWQLAEMGFSTRFFDTERAETVFRSIPLVGRLPLHIGRVRVYAGIGSPLDNFMLSASVGVTGIEWGN